MAVQMFLPAAIAIAAKYFPLLATRLGGPRGGAIAAHVVQMAATAAGVPPGTDAREVLAALEAEPSRGEALRLELAELDFREHEAEIRDRDSARTYQMRIGPSGRMRGNIMLAGVVIGLFACVWAATSNTAENEASILALVTTIAGALLKMLSDAFAFEFGSSAGSKEKDTQIERFQTALIDVNRAHIRREAASPSAVVTDGPVIAMGDSNVIDASDEPGDAGGRRTRDFVAELRRMAGTA